MPIYPLRDLYDKILGVCVHGKMNASVLLCSLSLCVFYAMSVCMLCMRVYAVMNVCACMCMRNVRSVLDMSNELTFISGILEYMHILLTCNSCTHHYNAKMLTPGSNKLTIPRGLNQFTSKRCIFASTLTCKIDNTTNRCCAILTVDDNHSLEAALIISYDK